MKFEVSITNTTPVFSAAPSPSTITLDGKVNAPAGGFPYTRTRRMKVISVSPDGSKQVVSVPVVPGNTMRNLLRRSILKHAIEPVMIEHEKLSVSAYAAAYSGNASGNPDGKPSTFDETVSIRKHPFLGLFGGGPRMQCGKLRTDTLFPVTTKTASVLGLPFEDCSITDSGASSITDTVWTRRVDCFTQIKEEADAALLKEGREAVNQWMNTWFLQTADKSKAKKTEADEEEVNSARGLQAFNAHEVVIPGIDWVWKLALDTPTDAQVGLVLIGLMEITKLSLGGGNAKGYGDFTINSIKVDGNEVWSDGSLIGNAEPFVKAAMDSLSELTADDFEQFAASGKK